MPEDLPFRHSCEGPDDMVRDTKRMRTRRRMRRRRKRRRRRMSRRRRRGTSGR